jgi:hypothetical protein
MKKLKFYQIIAAITCATCSMNIRGMDSGTIQGMAAKTVAALGSLASDAYKGISNRTLGYADPLMKEIAALDIDPLETNRDHRYEHAIDELVDGKDYQKLFALIEKVNNHNAIHESLAFHMSPQHQAKIQQPLQELYAKKRKELIADAALQANGLIAQWELDYEVLIHTMGEKESTIRNMSSIIAAAGGKQPDDQSVMNELESLLAIKTQYTFAATLARLLALESKKKASTAAVAIALATSSSSTTAITTTQTSTTTTLFPSSATATASTTTTTKSPKAAAASSNSSSNPSPAATISSGTPLGNSDGEKKDADTDSERDEAATPPPTITSSANSANAGKREDDATAKKKKKKKKKAAEETVDDDEDDN